MRINFGGNIFGRKNFGDFLLDSGLICGESPKILMVESCVKNLTEKNFGEFLTNISLKFGDFKKNFSANQTKKSITLILVLSYHQ